MILLAKVDYTLRKEKEDAFIALNGILAGHVVDLDKEREERIYKKTALDDFEESGLDDLDKSGKVKQ